MLSLVPFPNTSILLTSALISIPIISRYAVDHIPGLEEFKGSV